MGVNARAMSVSSRPLRSFTPPRVLTVNLSMTPSHLAFSSLEARTHLAGHL